MVDESFSSNDISAGIIPELSDKCRNVSQSLLNYYVRVEGLKISQVMLDQSDRSTRHSSIGVRSLKT